MKSHKRALLLLGRPNPKPGSLAPSESVYEALLRTATVSKVFNPRGEIRWKFGNQPHRAKYHQAWGDRMAAALEMAIRYCDGGLPALMAYPDTMPLAMRRRATVRHNKGKPRKAGWKWNEAAKAKLSASLKERPPAKPRRRGYPRIDFAEDGTFPLPAEGHHFTISRAAIEKLLALVLP